MRLRVIFALLVITLMLVWLLPNAASSMAAQTQAVEESPRSMVINDLTVGNNLANKSSLVSVRDALGGALANAENVELVGQIGGESYAVAVQDNYAYLGVGPRLIILDISTPGNPVVVTQSDVLAGIVRDIVIVGNHAYVAAELGGLRIFDMSNPVAPVEIGALDTPSRARGIAIANNHAYVADYNSLRIIDVTNPSDPTEVGFFYGRAFMGTGHIVAVAVMDNYAYVAASDDGLRIINIANPALPTEVATFNMSDANDVAIAGDYALVADESSLRIINVADPAAPSEEAVLDMGGFVSSVVIADNLAYVDGDNSLHIIDITNPAAPTESSNIEGSARDIAIAGDYAYLAYDGLHIINVANPATPSQVGAFETTLGVAEDVVVADNYAYCVNRDGLHIIDVTNPTSPTKMGSFAGSLSNMVIADNYVYGTLDSSMRIINVANPASPSEVASVDMPGRAQDIAVAGNYAYVTYYVSGDQGSRSGLLIFDISNPTSPTEAGVFETQNYVREVAVAGNYAYLAASSDGLYVIDISNPATPSKVTTLDTIYPSSVAIANNYAYVADGSSGLRIIDITNPAAPTEVSIFKMPYIYNIVMKDNYAYVSGSWNDSLRIINVANPAAPSESGFYDTPGHALKIAVMGSYVYVADLSGGLTILSFAPPASTTIPTSGGTLTSMADNTSYTFPADTFTDTVTITHTVRFPSQVPATGSLSSINHFFEVNASYVSSGQPAQPASGRTYEVSVQYSDEDIGVVNENRLALYYWDETQWVKEPTSTVDSDTNSVSATPSHFSIWAVLAEKAENTHRLYLPTVIR